MRDMREPVSVRNDGTFAVEHHKFPPLKIPENLIHVVIKRISDMKSVRVIGGNVQQQIEHIGRPQMWTLQVRGRIRSISRNGSSE